MEFRNAVMRFTKSTTLWTIPLLLFPFAISLLRNRLLGEALSSAVPSLVPLLLIAATGSLLLSFMTRKLGPNKLASLFWGFLLGLVLRPIAGILWYEVHPGFEESAILAWGVIMAVPGAIGGTLAGWFQWRARSGQL